MKVTVQLDDVVKFFDNVTQIKSFLAFDIFPSKYRNVENGYQAGYNACIDEILKERN